MKKFSVVSVDMFRTLADLDNVERTVWHQILKDNYTEELAEECRDMASSNIYRHLPEDGFVPMKHIFSACFRELIDINGVELDPDEAAEIWAKAHSLCEPYPEAVPFLKAVGARYTVCLSSDADNDMLEGLVKKMYPFDYVFASENMGSYKVNTDGRFFKVIADHYKVGPEAIIHVGDGRLEIIAAHNAGLVTCWLNRRGQEWQHEIKPDYQAASLTEFASILGVEVSHV
jgi:2-haloalkanoic acid dehalogenase type II